MATSIFPSGGTDAGFHPRYADRRARTRLRELCDEVIASYRAATSGELFTAQDREEARALLARVLPSYRSDA